MVNYWCLIKYIYRKMAQTSQTPIRPITLTIIPQINQTTPVAKTTVNTMPNFQYAPIIPPPSYVVGAPKHGGQNPLVAENDKLEYQRRLNREYQQKHREKVKGFTAIARLPTINERIKEVWLLTYPDTSEKLDDQTINTIISQFVNNMVISISNPN